MRDKICNKTICSKSAIYSLSVATSSFKIRFNLLPIQLWNNLNIGIQTAFVIAI